MRRLRTSIDDAGLANYVASQANTLFPDERVVEPESIRSILPAVLGRVEHCFTRIGSKYFFDGSEAIFNHLHGDQYAMFLYLASNTGYRSGLDESVLTKLFLLNKALHGIDAFYEVELPSIFLFVHPLGTVLGRARYSDYFVAYQRCGVGSNHDIYPEFGEFVTLHPGSAVLGKSRIGRNCAIATESLILDKDLPDDTQYIGDPRDFVIRRIEKTLPIWRTGTP